MYSAWRIKINETNEDVIIFGIEVKVDQYKKEHLANEDYGSGFTGKTKEEIESIVKSLKINYPTARLLLV